MRIAKERMSSLLLALAVCLSCIAPAAAAETKNTATRVKVAKAEGKVEVTSASGRSLPVRTDMSLSSGCQIKTGQSGYLWLNLDDTKTNKIDECSSVELRKDGKKIEMLLKSGNMFFNVTKPLEEDESLNIRSHTIIMGVRGTCGWLEASDQGTTTVNVLEGTVQCVVCDPVSGDTASVPVQSGESFTFVASETKELAAAGGEIRPTAIKPEEIKGFILLEVAQNPELAQLILEKGGPDLTEVTVEQALEKMAAEEQAVAEQMTVIAAQEAGQASGTAAAAESTPTSTVTPNNNHDYSDESDPEPTPTPTPTPTPEPEPDTPEPPAPGPDEPVTPPDPGPDPDTPEPPAPGPDEPVTPPDPGPASETVKANVGINAIQNKLNTCDSVTVESSGPLSILTIDKNLEIPAGKTLTVNDDVLVRLASGKTLRVNGTMNALGESFTNLGTLEVAGSIRTASEISNGLGGTLTLLDSGEITSDSDTATVYQQGGTLNLESGTLSNTSGAPALKVGIEGSITFRGASLRAVVSTFPVVVEPMVGKSLAEVLGELSTTEEGGMKIVTRTSYTITFDVGIPTEAQFRWSELPTAPAQQVVYHGESITLPANLSSSDNGGIFFEGWFAESDPSVKLVDGTAAGYTTPTRWVARWWCSVDIAPNYHEMSKWDSDDIVFPDGCIGRFDDMVSLPTSLAPSKTEDGKRYVFSGWNSKADGSGTDAEASVPAYLSSAWYAQWTQESTEGAG